MKSTRFSIGDKIGTLIYVGMIAYFSLFFAFFIWLATLELSFENFDVISALTGTGSIILMSIPFAIIGIPIAWAFCLIFGLPVWVATEKIVGESRRIATIAGAVVGVLSLPFWLLMLSASPENFREPSTWVMLMIYLLFCLLMGRWSHKIACNIRQKRLEAHS